jgi:putative redox protein
MVQIDIEYVGDLQCVATHAPSGVTLKTDPPVDNKGQGRSFSPTDLAATSLGTCMMTVLAIAALERPDIELRGTKVQVLKEMTKTAPRKIAALHVTFTFPRDFTAEQRRFIEEKACGCPVCRSLHPDVRVPLKFVYPN